jgi:hypothetical protein
MGLAFLKLILRQAHHGLLVGGENRVFEALLKY